MSATVELGDQTLHLHPERAAVWPDERAVLVADVHLGKDQIFRNQGVAIPAGVLQSDLARLSGLLEDTGSERLIVLGDWVHAPPREGDLWPEEIRCWRRQHQSLSIELVEGNHDRALASWLAEWNMTAQGAILQLGGLSLVHEWHPSLTGPGVSGHLHPGAVIRAGHDRVRLPAFLKSADHLVLPAFGRFTGLMDCPGFPAREQWVIAESRVLPLPLTKRA
ncbi:MAG: ligase-associated DNA damage response endonuclease PdeM [Wenzhouxiangella sp.]|jgi:DNA ligase-associated metallophosphoesterase|nr:ligase-associated DNA damage response endonuclease PdeM [Wenzhouxiangella sp.]